MLSERALRPGVAEDQVADDLVAAHQEIADQIIAEAAHADGRPPISDEARLAAARGTRDAVLFFDGATPVALGIVGNGELDLVVRPASRGQGVGASALTLLLAHARTDRLVAWSHGDNPAADALLAQSGFTPARSLLRLTLDPALLPDAAAPPKGFTLRRYDPHSAGGDLSDDASDAAAWVRVNAAAFAHHPEQGKLARDDFAARTAEPWFDGNDLLLAHDQTGELAGSAWVKTLETRGGDPDSTPAAETELYAIGVRPDLAGRGLGAALTTAALARMKEHRPERVTLYVEGDNGAALTLYLRAGFTEDSRSQQWERGRAHS
jgi:mycothiol synthase